VQPSMEEGLIEKAVVPDGKIAFDRSKNCSSK
jgi:copper homeostasis protein (lipoprotein)